MRSAFVRALLCLGVILVSIASSLSSQDGASVSLAWDPSPDASVAGYYVHFGTASGGYTERADAGATTSLTISNLTPGLTYYFAVTAYTTGLLESDPSNEISFLVPGVLRLSVTNAPFFGEVMQIAFPTIPDRVYTLQASADLAAWFDLWHTIGKANVWVNFLDLGGIDARTRFYRLVWTEEAARK